MADDADPMEPDNEPGNEPDNEPDNEADNEADGGTEVVEVVEVDAFAQRVSVIESETDDAPFVAEDEFVAF